MKIKQVVLASGCICSLLYGGIGENFERGGVWLGGDGWVRMYDIGSESSGTAFSVNLNQKFFLVDNLSFGFSEGYGNFGDGNDMFLLRGSVGYTFLHDGSKSTGPAHTVAVEGGLSFRDEYETFHTVKPYYQFEYFVTERIAPYISVGPDFWFVSDEDVRTNMDINFGVALHFPTKMRVTIPAE